jgi:hypothetical protein
MSRAEKTMESSPWVVPGVLIGAYALTRLPFGLLTGLAVGFAAGWTLRAEQGSPGERGTRRERREAQPEEEKVDEMVDHSFPASDPPSYTPTKAGKPKQA